MAQNTIEEVFLVKTADRDRELEVCSNNLI